MLLCKEVFKTDRRLWLANAENDLYPNPHAERELPNLVDDPNSMKHVFEKTLVPSFSLAD
jgi:hypothetical protein